jgi:poly-gamma-glutamate synthesis protein (capsule biosynthesis protein)
MIDNEENTIKADDEQRIFRSFGVARDQKATVIAYHHNHRWNQQKVNEAGGMEQWRVDFAHRCIERGADVYFSHGQPRLQGIEIYQGKPIFYGLGNFVFQTKKVNFYQSEVWESVLAELEYDADPSAQPNTARRIKSVKLIPIILNQDGAEPAYFQTRGLPALAKGDQAKNILLRLQKMSQQYGTRIEIDDSNPQAIFGKIRI